MTLARQGEPAIGYINGQIPLVQAPVEALLEANTHYRRLQTSKWQGQGE
jgi:hypothetical protein